MTTSMVPLLIQAILINNQQQASQARSLAAMFYIAGTGRRQPRRP